MDNKPPRNTGHWEHFPHEADMGIRGVGASMEEAFAQAALALTAVVTDPVGIQLRETVTLTAEDPDPELLLVDFLNAVIFEMARRRMLFGRFQVTITDSRLHAAAQGETVLAVKRRSDGAWLAQCVVDV